MAKPYTYHAIGIGEIRILVLSPSLHGEPLSGTLETATLNDWPDYHAVSYTWGLPVFNKVLELSEPDNDPIYELRITESLYGALKRFRNDTRSVRIWADATCINQSDGEERNQQVNVMAQIFSQAQRVLVWLGEQSEEDTLAFWMIGAMQRYYNKSGVLNTASPAWDHITSRFDVSHSRKEQRCPCCHSSGGLSLVYDGIPSFNASLNALIRLLERPYFSRMWVVQEIIGIREEDRGYIELYCGRHNCSGPALFRAVATADHLISYFDGPVELAPTGPNTPVFATFEFLSRVPDHLIYTLMATRNLQCSDPRDRLFAGRALSDIEDVGTLIPDYSIAVEALWQRVASYLLSSKSPRAIDEGCIDASFVLAIIGTQNVSSNPEERSSWAPDLWRWVSPRHPSWRYRNLPSPRMSA